MRSRLGVILVVLGVLVLFSGCAQKLPDRYAGNGGIIAFPVHAVIEDRQPFFYRYALAGSKPIPFEIRLDPVMGKKFFISDVLPPGDYVADRWIVNGIPSQTMSLSISKQEKTLKKPYHFTIEDGKITMHQSVFVVKVYATESHSYTQNYEWKSLTDSERKAYAGELKTYENANGWDVVIRGTRSSSKTKVVSTPQKTTASATTPKKITPEKKKNKVPPAERPVTPKKVERLTVLSDGSVKDGETGLVWAPADNGADISWEDAKDFCESYAKGGHADWRMPTSDELLELYYSGVRSKNKKGSHVVQISSWAVWASQEKGVKRSTFDFGRGGYSRWVDMSQAANIRALPVRSDK